MEISEFIKKLEVEFEELTPGTLQPETNFRHLKEWSSMHALIIIAVVDTEYNVSLKGEELRAVSTISDLFDLVTKKKSAHGNI